jgi:serine protease AprX
LFKIYLFALIAFAYTCSVFASDQPVLMRGKKSPVIHQELSAYVESVKPESLVPIWIFFTDKGISSMPEYRTAVEAYRAELTPRALLRRRKVMKNDLITFGDLPMADSYITQLSSLGFQKRHISRWLNAVSGFIDQDKLPTLASLSFVRQIALLHTSRHLPMPKAVLETQEAMPEESFRLRYGSSLNQLQQINVPAVHDLGYSGKGVIICMLDTGFNLHHEALQHVVPIGEHDFVFNDDVTQNEPGLDRADQDNHGTETLSVLGGLSDNHLYGPAFGASFILAKTEDMRSETSIEEDNWVAAIEWAEGLGVDVASSSLGYLDWYVYTDMNGDSAITTKAADMAAARGVVVCVAAGNWQQDSWHYISAPADADSIISVGAVNDKGLLAGFSSVGPTFDGRIKPEVVARGVSNWMVNPSDSTGYFSGSGTSFSAPLIGGVAALIVEAHPTWTPMQVRESLMMTADRASNPDNQYGWGLVNALKAIQYHQKGDVDGNDQWNEEDILLAAKIILDTYSYSDAEFTSADMNRDDDVNILDIVSMVKLINPLPD